jgi:hypothetical protein
MSLWTKVALGAAAVVACANAAVAQHCSSCAAGAAKRLSPGVPNAIPKCNRHDGLTQYPLDEKRYIKQFCNPTICPSACFGHFKTQWTAWPQACPGWPQDGVDPANFGPNFTRYAQPAEAIQPADPKAEAAAEPKVTPPADPKPAPLPPKAATPEAPPQPPPSKPLPAPMPVIPPLPGAGTIPDLPKF